jgi:hypothetical protein
MITGMLRQTIKKLAVVAAGFLYWFVIHADKMDVSGERKISLTSHPFFVGKVELTVLGKGINWIM